MTDKPSGPGPASGASDNPALVDSLNHPLAIVIREILNRAEERRVDRILIDDVENIDRALEARVPIDKVFHAGDEQVPDALRRKLPRRTTIHEVAKRTCKKLFENDKISRVFAIAPMPPARDLASLAAVRGDIVVLEDLSISGNIGAIVRTSVAFSVAGIVLLNAAHQDIYDRRLIRASRGHVFSLPVVTASTSALIDFCKARDVRMLVTAPRASLTIEEISTMRHRLAIVFGAEKEGCSPAIVDAADIKVTIPTRPEVESLNVSAAAAITLHRRFMFNAAATSDDSR